ncbi:HupE/UreJ family protein [Gammaproteobacteria bacterium]|nr:HupE/UreJ family protein [Gammaproteobacteria bacterium]
MKKLYLVLFLFTITHVSAHEFNPAHLVINELDDELNTYEATWMYPYKNIGTRGEVIFPDICSVESKDLYYQGKYINEELDLTCSSTIKGSLIEITKLSVLTDALVTINFSNDETFEGLVNNKNTSILVPNKDKYMPTSYIYLGFDHLLNGLDHILFVVGLMFLVVGTINLIKTITAFTIAHSITLGLSVFNIIKLPQATIEIMIALTIVYLAAEIKNSKKYEFTPWNLAFGFGLLHGLGFAGALSDIGIENNEILLSLLFFNAGIEIGQLILIPFIWIFIFIANNYNFYKKSVVFSSYFVGSMGAYWVISRFINLFY